MMHLRLLIVPLLGAMMSCGSGSSADGSIGAKTSTAPQGLTKYVSNDGAPRIPADYKGPGWTHLGSWSVAPPAEGAEVNQIHHVYAETSAVEQYRKKGKWPNGSTLVKELRNVKPALMTTGRAAGGGEIDGWFVMVKNSNKPSKSTPHWGDGWHGSQFSIEDRNLNVSPGWGSCKGCHLPVQDTDWVFVDGYPDLEN